MMLMLKRKLKMVALITIFAFSFLTFSQSLAMAQGMPAYGAAPVVLDQNEMTEIRGELTGVEITFLVLALISLGATIYYGEQASNNSCESTPSDYTYTCNNICTIINQCSDIDDAGDKVINNPSNLYQNVSPTVEYNVDSSMKPYYDYLKANNKTETDYRLTDMGADTMRIKNLDTGNIITMPIK